MKNKKKYGLLAAVICSAAMLLVNTPVQVQAETTAIVTNDENGIPDTNLYNAVLRAADTNKDGVLTVSEAEELSSLSAAKSNISNLTGIGVCKKISNFSLHSNESEIKEIDALKDLKSLKSLGLTNCEIKDIGVLKDLKTLTYLDLSNSKIKDISALKDLKSLTTLKLGNNEIKEIDALKDLKALTYLELNNNKIKEIDALKDLKSLKTLYLDGNEIKEIDALKDLKTLKVLGLSNNEINDFDALKNLELSILDLSSNGIKEIGALKDLKTLTTLYLEQNEIKDISTLKDLNALTSLDLDYNEIEEIDALKDLKTLKFLNLGENKIKDISALKDLNTLTFLYLSFNYIEDVSPLDGLIANGCEVYVYNQKVNQDTPSIPEDGNTSEIPSVPKDETTPETPSVSENLTGKSKFIALLYENVLERSASEDEIANWVQELENGKSGADTAFGFIFSEEFTNKNLSNSEYVERLYQSMMGRASDEGGKSNWVTHLENGVSRLYVFKQFVNSQEFTNLCEEYAIVRGDVELSEARDMNYNVTRFVARNYREFLGRDYDEAGLNDWTSRINHREQTMQEIAAGFVFSQECTNKNLSDEAYVQMLYRGCFDRTGDEAGVTDWVSKLAAGSYDREAVFWGFANSQEFANMVSSYGL